MIYFSWDKNKATSNLRKHGISFLDAKEVFKDEFATTNQDRVENGEERWQTIGRVGNALLIVLVAYTWDEDENAQYIRIISARPATRSEIRDYEKQRK